MSSPRDSTGSRDERARSRRDVLRRSLGAIAATPVLVGSTGTASAAPGDGPSGVHLGYGADPTTTLTAGWTGVPAAGAAVEFGRDGFDRRAPATAAPLPGRDTVAYTAELTGLAPGTTYDYRAVLDGRRSRSFSATTAPAAGDAFRVTAVGDHGVADPDNPFQRANTADPVRVMERAASLDPAFQLLVGDIAYANGHPSTWELYFETFEDIFANRPLMTVPGNHEAEPGTGLTQYDRRLDDLMPSDDRTVAARNQPRWYDFRYGDALFVGLNTTTDECGGVARSEEFVPIYDVRCRTEEGLTYGEVQGRYLERTLGAAARDPAVTWTVVYFHGPLWTSSPDHPDREDLRRRWGALFDEYGVDLVLSGDNHVYERSKPIVGTSWEEGYGTTYVTNGTGGTSHYAFAGEEAPGFLAFRSNEHFGLTTLDVDDRSLDVSYVAADGTVVDAFRVVKDHRGRPTQRELSTAAVAARQGSA